MLKAIVNANLVFEDRILERGAILMEHGTILACGDILIPEGTETTDAKGLYAGPGYVDIHCHGGGRSLAETDPAGAAEHHLNSGTTSLLMSLAYNLPKDVFFAGIETIRRVMEQGETTIAGIHYEGPYTNPKYGAQAKAAWALCKEDYEKMMELGKGLVRQCTYAPELPGIEAYERYVRGCGVALAVGHTEMSPCVLDRAVANGATIVTHLFDAMGCWRGNESIAVTGILQESAADVALAKEGLYYELICDSRGVHVKPCNMRLALRCAGEDRIILITDATVYPEDKTIYPESDPRSSVDLNYNDALELSGSKLTMAQAVQNMQRYTGASVRAMFKMGATNAAKAVGLYHRVGSLAPGKEANILLCDEHMALGGVYFRGRKVK